MLTVPQCATAPRLGITGLELRAVFHNQGTAIFKARVVKVSDALMDHGISHLMSSDIYGPVVPEQHTKTSRYFYHFFVGPK